MLPQLWSLKLKPKKCQLLKDEALFLGHVVSGEGISPSPVLVKDVQDWQPPMTTQELQAFLGLCNYYHRLVPAFAELASPLTALLKKSSKFQWGESQQQAFVQLKDKLTTAPVRGYPASMGKYILYTLLQWGEERVTSYASSHLTPAQQRYCVTRHELLAIVRYTRQFRHYLLDQRFLLRTDHYSLTWLFRFKHPEGQLVCWLEELSQYDFEIEHLCELAAASELGTAGESTEG